MNIYWINQWIKRKKKTCLLVRDLYIGGKTKIYWKHRYNFHKILNKSHSEGEWLKIRDKEMIRLGYWGTVPDEAFEVLLFISIGKIKWIFIYISYTALYIWHNSIKLKKGNKGRCKFRDLSHVTARKS